MSDSITKINIGCQGWNYSDWTTKAGGESVFYPRGTKPNEMLEIYSKIFETVEVDSTFYAIPATSTVEGWYQKTGDNFTFSLKLPQEITHDLNLRKNSYVILEEFCERSRELKEKLAAVLIQLPPQFEANKENAQNLRNFLEQLPKNIRFAVEFRNREWMVNWTYEELEKNNVALCLVEGSWIPREIMFETIGKSKVDFSYVRWMGERNLENFDKVVRPQNVNLEMWKAELEKLRNKNVFAYFSNFYEGHAPASANKLMKCFGQEITETESLENQGSLF
jgi:uncharacterized protein YecE (DUF72 family)